MKSFVNVESGDCILISIMSGINGNVCCLPENHQDNKHPIPNVFLPIWGRLSLKRKAFSPFPERETPCSVPDVMKKFSSLNGILTKEQFARPWSSHSFHAQSRQIGNQTSYCSSQMHYICCFYGLLGPALGLPLCEGFQSTKEGSSGSQDGPKLCEWGCWCIWYNEHHQAVPVSLGELLKWGLPSEGSFQREQFDFSEFLFLL